MSTRDLFNGIAVLIDDEYGDENAAISAIAKQISEAGGHVIGLTSLPEAQQIANLRGASFFVVDWNLDSKPIVGEDGSLEAIHIPAGVREASAEKTRKFLKDLRDRRFAPVFIFTNEPVDTVIESLGQDAGLYVKDQPTHIFVKAKDEVLDQGVFAVLTEWVEKTPSALALKRWEQEYESAKNALFTEFHSKSIYWPAVLWQTFKEDGVPPSPELGRLISRNLLSRMTPFGMDMEVFMPAVEERRAKDPEAYRDMLCKVLEGERFVANSGLHQDSVSPGDVFKFKGSYWVNIRPDCDCVPRPGSRDPELYLLKGSKVSDGKLLSALDIDYGLVRERDNECVVFQMTDGISVSFKLNELTQKKWSEIKGKRIGRLIPPFSTRLQQRYAAYLQRPGLPKIPKAAMPLEAVANAAAVVLAEAQAAAVPAAGPADALKLARLATPQAAVVPPPEGH